jgi:hypothetical protein
LSVLGWQHCLPSWARSLCSLKSFRGRQRSGLSRGWEGSIHNTSFLNDVVPAGTQAHLYCNGCHPSRFWRGRSAGCTARLSALRLPPLCKCRPSFLLLETVPIIGCMVTPQLQHLSCSLAVEYSPERCLATSNTPGRISEIALRVTEPLTALTLQWGFWCNVISTETRRPQSSINDRTFVLQRPVPPTL